MYPIGTALSITKLLLMVMMFALVKFDDNNYFVCEKRRITNIKDSSCTVKWRSGGQYKASLIIMHESKCILEGFSKTMSAGFPYVVLEKISKLNNQLYVRNEGICTQPQTKLHEDDVFIISNTDGSPGKELAMMLNSSVLQEMMHDFEKQLECGEVADVGIDDENLSSTIEPEYTVTIIQEQINVSDRKIINNDVLFDCGTVIPSNINICINHKNENIIEPLVATDINIHNSVVEVLEELEPILPSLVQEAYDEETNNEILYNGEMTMVSNINMCTNHMKKNIDEPPVFTDNNINKSSVELLKTLPDVQEVCDVEAINNTVHDDVIVTTANTNTVRKNDKEQTLPVRTESNTLPTVQESIEACDEDVVYNELQSSTTRTKKNFCIYCKKLLAKLPRHLQQIHYDEEEVKKFCLLPKGCSERLGIIETIRRRGNFEYNSKSEYNKGFLIACRRPQIIKERTVENYEYCSNCKGLFAKRTLHRHHRKCAPESKKGDRNVMVLGRRIHAKIHPKACRLLKETVFPIMREDDVVTVIRYDELLIIFANTLCRKYSTQQNHNMIRAKLRLLGRFLIKLKEINKTVTDFASVFNAKNYDATVDAVNAVAHLNKESTKYGTPTPAFHLGTLLKQSGNVLITECIKKMDEEKKKEVQDFLKLIEVDYGLSVNRTVMESQREIKRSKKVQLPNTDDIKKLCNYLNKHRRTTYTQLKESFSFELWKNLAQYTLTTIQVFNRRRAGEIERIKISDFRNYQTVNENTDRDTYNSLSQEMQQKAKNYVRFTIRGKLGREVPVLLHKEYVDCIELIIQYRQRARIADANPFVFSLPDTRKGYYNHLSACCLMRKFSSACGAKNPQLLRGTQLRKHVATQCVLFNLQEYEVSDVASFMGHGDKIHRNYYRMPIVTREITLMSKLLERAQGCDIEETEERDVENETNCVKPVEADLLSNRHSGMRKRKPDPAQLSPPIKRRLFFTSKQNDNNEEKNDEGYSNTEQSGENILRSSGGKDTREKIPKTHSLSPFGKIKRLSWTTPEKTNARKLFQSNIENEVLPSLRYCAEVLATHPDLHNRTPNQLYAWVNNQIKAKQAGVIQDTTTTKRNKRVVISWRTPEKNILRRSFHDNIVSRKLPNLEKCSQVKEEHSEILVNRTPITIKAWVNNQIKKLASKG